MEEIIFWGIFWWVKTLFLKTSQLLLCTCVGIHWSVWSWKCHDEIKALQQSPSSSWEFHAQTCLPLVSCYSFVPFIAVTDRIWRGNNIERGNLKRKNKLKSSQMCLNSLFVSFTLISTQKIQAIYRTSSTCILTQTSYTLKLETYDFKTQGLNSYVFYNAWTSTLNAYMKLGKLKA